MISLRILDIKLLMQKLLLDRENAFDDYYLSEAVVKMAVTYSIDGHLNKDFGSPDDDFTSPDDELNEINMAYWKDVKQNVFSVIKGKKVPAGFNIILYKRHDHTNFMLRLSYDGSELFALTGTVCDYFTLDKSIDRIWDDEVIKFFTLCGIPFERQ